MTRYEVLTSGGEGAYAAIVGYRKIEGDDVMDKLNTVMKRCEKSHIRMVLDEHGWNKPKTAKALGVSQSTLYRKIAELGIRK